MNLYSISNQIKRVEERMGKGAEDKLFTTGVLAGMTQHEVNAMIRSLNTTHSPPRTRT